mgnify:CR=1 FL=1
MASERRIRLTAPDRSGSGPSRAGDLVGALFGPVGASRLSAAQQAARAWFSANGDRERAHTTGVWLRKSGRAGVDPVLVVRLDSSLLAQELGTNKDLYLTRLAHAGVSVSDIRFDVGAPRPGGGRGALATAQKERAAQTPPPRTLSADEQRSVERATAGLPDGLRQSAARAMRATLARQRDHTQNGE